MPAIVPSQPALPTDVGAAFERAVALHRAGRLEAAQDAYAAVLAAHPGHAGCLAMLGALHLQCGRPADSVACLEAAVVADPEQVGSWNNLGNALRATKRPAEAITRYDRAIALNPAYAEAHFNRAVTLRDLNRLEEALAAYRRAVDLRPRDARFQLGHGLILRDLKRYPEALATLKRSIALDPQQAAAHNALGNLQRDLGDPDAALASYAHALSLRPDYVEALTNRGAVLSALGRHPEALDALDRAIALRPGFADAHYNRAVVLCDLERPEEAIGAYEAAIRHRPSFAAAYYNLAIVLRDLNRLPAALAANRGALAQRPDYPEANWNQAMLLLQQGDFAAGWPLYEWRWKNGACAPFLRRFDQPLWLGREDPRGKTLLLHAEQGLGDSIQFCRYASLLAARGAHVILQVQAALVALAQTLGGGVTVLAEGETPPPFDMHCPLMSLPLALGTRLDDIPAAPTYLCVPPAARELWQRRLGAAHRLRVGLVWSGRPQHGNDRNRSLALATLRPLLALAADFHCLQKEIRPADRAVLAETPQIREWCSDLRDFSDTAALSAAMDLVISVDTAGAHLAAALGRQTWILLPQVADFRWLVDREDSPWYPTARLFRQQHGGDWAGVVERVAGELARRAHDPRGAC